MKFGVAFANVGPFVQPEDAAFLARTCEEVGIESLWTVEHVVVPTGYRSQYPYSTDGRMPGPENSSIPDPLPVIAELKMRMREMPVSLLTPKKRSSAVPLKKFPSPIFGATIVPSDAPKASHAWNVTSLNSAPSVQTMPAARVPARHFTRSGG